MGLEGAELEKFLKEADYLNVGCGTARYPKCINMDVVKNKYVDADIIGNVTNIPFPNGRFKGVIFAHVLEHLVASEHKLALLNIRRVLAPEGTVYVEVPDFELAMKYWLENRKGRRDYWYQCIYGRDAYTSDRHLSGITRQYLTDILFETGFEHLRWLDFDVEEALMAVIATRASKMQASRL